jgi:hypothetical protein
MFFNRQSSRQEEKNSDEVIWVVFADETVELS